MSVERRLLVVDDESDICLFLKQLLEQEGYSVLTACSGKEALDLARQQTIDILITDIRMPGMDGIELIGKMSGLNRHIQSIVLTGHGDISTAIEAMKKGSLNYLKKPINFDELLITVARGLSIIKLQENLEKRTTELEGSNQELKKALSEIKQLKKFLPICSSCKKMRDEKGEWTSMESYIQTHTDSVFSHSLCPDCADIFYGQESWYQNLKNKSDKG